MEITIEQAEKNLLGLLNSPELKLCKNDHIILEQSLALLLNKAKEPKLIPISEK